jgi:hypothetical protein
LRWRGASWTLGIFALPGVSRSAVTGLSTKEVTGIESGLRQSPSCQI